MQACALMSGGARRSLGMVSGATCSGACFKNCVPSAESYGSVTGR